jgi:hypothetical protein
MREALAERAVPTITLWNRLEPQPRADDFSRALKAEVRDALWMLTKQWQMGEFAGDDAGSPVLARMHLTRTTLTKYQAGGGPVQPFDRTTPLEAQVERRPIPFARAGGDVSLDIRLTMGRHWLKLVADLGDFTADFAARYPVRTPDQDKAADAPIAAHAESYQVFRAARRLMDGYKLYHLAGDPAHRAYDGIPALAGLEAAITARETRFLAWFRRQFHAPAQGADAWEPDRLEYRFACAAPREGAEAVLTAKGYHHGHLDWYSLDLDPAPTLGDVAAPIAPTLPPDTQTTLPVPVAFPGMPSTRWWAFEDRRVNFGDVRPDTTDLGKLLLIDFALVFANDWFLIPYQVPVGSLTRLVGLAVTNVFGERIFVEAAGRGPDDGWQRWAMYRLATAGAAPGAADTSLLVLPMATTVQEGKPLEEVLLMRDEVANMVWGVERTIPLPSGVGKPGGEAARELLAWHEAHAGPAKPAAPAPANEARIAYETMTSVPEHWIPFLPVQVAGDNRQVQLQRGSMPRILRDGTVGKVKPRTDLLRPGLDAAPPAPYHLHEEEVPRAGVRVAQAFQRTRWRDGSVHVWLGVRKRTGRGEGASGLAFDRIVDRLPPEP